MEKLNVAIADDNERMLNLLGEIVESDKDLKLVGKARNGEDIYHIIRDKQPDVVLLDLIMPKMDGISVMEMIGVFRHIRNLPDPSRHMARFRSVSIPSGLCKVFHFSALLPHSQCIFSYHPYSIRVR